MSNQSKSPLATIITVIIVAGLSLMPSAVKSCSRHSGNQSSASYSNTTREDSNDYRGYQIRFADDFKEGLATQDDFGLSVMIAVDCSGSMDEYPSESTGGDQKKYVTASQSLA
jgi:hypothetical protein